MQTVNKGGDVLARGNARCTYPPAGGNVSQKKWNSIFEGFNAEEYRKSAKPKDENAEKAEGKSDLGR
jgi:hypothetical protein